MRIENNIASRNVNSRLFPQFVADRCDKPHNNVNLYRMIKKDLVPKFQIVEITLKELITKFRGN